MIRSKISGGRSSRAAETRKSIVFTKDALGERENNFEKDGWANECE